MFMRTIYARAMYMRSGISPRGSYAKLVQASIEPLRRQFFLQRILIQPRCQSVEINRVERLILIET